MVSPGPCPTYRAWPARLVATESPPRLKGRRARRRGVTTESGKLGGRPWEVIKKTPCPVRGDMANLYPCYLSTYRRHE